MQKYQRVEIFTGKNFRDFSVYLLAKILLEIKIREIHETHWLYLYRRRTNRLDD